MVGVNRKELCRNSFQITVYDRFRATVAGLAFPEGCRVGKANPVECREEKAERVMAQTMEDGVLRLWLNFPPFQMGQKKGAIP